jgi:hypothetical protein
LVSTARPGQIPPDLISDTPSLSHLRLAYWSSISSRVISPDLRWITCRRCCGLQMSLVRQSAGSSGKFDRIIAHCVNAHLSRTICVNKEIINNLRPIAHLTYSGFCKRKVEVSGSTGVISSQTYIRGSVAEEDSKPRIVGPAPLGAPASPQAASWY